MFINQRIKRMETKLRIAIGSCESIVDEVATLRARREHCEDNLAELCQLLNSGPHREQAIYVRNKDGQIVALSVQDAHTHYRNEHKQAEAAINQIWGRYDRCCASKRGCQQNLAVLRQQQKLTTPVVVQLTTDTSVVAQSSSSFIVA